MIIITYNSTLGGANIKKWITQNSSIEICKVADKKCNCYLVSNDKFLVLIDTSISYEQRMILNRLNKLDVKMLHCIMLTHAHFDHAGNMRVLQEKYNSYVFIHSSEVQYINEGYTYLPKGTLPITKFFTTLIGNRIIWFQRYKGCDSDRIITEEKICEKLTDNLQIQILHTPGHTAGSVSFIIDNEIALVGDTLVNRKSNIFPLFADFPDLLPDAWKSLLGTKCMLFLPAHGKEIERDLLVTQYNKWFS